MRTHLPALAAVALLSAGAVHARDHFEIIVARNAANQLQVHADFPQPIGLPPSIFPGYSGYAAALPGFASIDLDEPEEDLFRLSLSSNSVCILVAADPGVQVWNGLSPMTPGQSLFLGPPPFDIHPLWHIPAAVPGRIYTIQLRIHDNANLHTDSDIITFAFTAGCYANCDGSTLAPFLNVNDFTCFLNRFAAADPAANCDESTAAPVLNISDFVCFLNKFAAGCP